jgi:hypothetical protein
VVTKTPRLALEAATAFLARIPERRWTSYGDLRGELVK